MASTKPTNDPDNPLKLVTVNTAPERAYRLIGRVIESLNDRYSIVHADNVDSKHDVSSMENKDLHHATDIDNVRSTVEKVQPDLLFCASMWTPEQSEQIQATAHELVPGIKTMALPQGLQVQRGPDAVVEYIVEKLPGLIES
ncbi:MAG: hypothetical protein MMC23_003140 [Stictis urceolatum]|nr:hypothetical protein [Stictis urceolata]